MSLPVSLASLASLVFALAAFAVVAALRLTIAQYRKAALANLAALDELEGQREVRVETVSVVIRRNDPGIRRGGPRGSRPRRFSPAEELRAAA